MSNVRYVIAYHLVFSARQERQCRVEGTDCCMGRPSAALQCTDRHITDILHVNLIISCPFTSVCHMLHSCRSTQWTIKNCHPFNTSVLNDTIDLCHCIRFDNETPRWISSTMRSFTMCAFSALTALFGYHEQHPECKELEWRRTGMEIQMTCIWPSWCHWLTQVVLEKETIKQALYVSLVMFWNQTVVLTLLKCFREN